MVRCLDELFRPHEDLLPLFFQFYAGMLKKGFEIPHDYVSPYRPKELKTYTKSTSRYGATYTSNPVKSKPKQESSQPTKS